MAPPDDSAIRKAKGNRKSLVQEVKKEKKWSEIFSCWAGRLAKPSNDDADKPPSESISKVLGTPELLGEVLKYVPSVNLLTNKQLVNCTWKNAIERTPAIKRKLWKKVQDPRVRQPFETTLWGNRRWHGGSYQEVRIINKGIPAYKGTFAINMLATPTRAMAQTVAKRIAEDAIRFPPPSPPPAPVGPIPFLRGLIHSTFPSLAPAPVQRTLVKPDWMQTSIEPTPCGPLMTVGFKILRSLCRGYDFNDDGSKSRVPEPPWLDMYLTDPPASTVWIKVQTTVQGDVECLQKVPSGITFSDIRYAVRHMARADERGRKEYSRDFYQVKICFVADGMVVDGERVEQVTNWV